MPRRRPGRSSARRRAGSRRAGDGRRRRLAGDRRGAGRRARPPVRLHPGRDAQPLRARPRRRPRRRRRRPRRLRRRRRARVDLAEVNGAGLRQQRLPRPLRRGGAAARATARRSSARCSDTCRTCSAPAARGPDLRWKGPGGPRARVGRRVLVSNNLYRLGRADRRGHAAAARRGRLGVAVFERRQRGADAGTRRGAGGASGRPPTSKSLRAAVPGGDRRRGGGRSSPAAVPDPPRGAAGPDRAPHPGASPSAILPDFPVAAAAPCLVRIAASRPG